MKPPLDTANTVILKWTPYFNKGEIIFEFKAPTRGWIAVGFSPNGGMQGGDMVTGWVKDGQIFHQVSTVSAELDAGFYGVILP